MLNTPVLLIIFNRPETTKQVFEAIRNTKPRQLFVAADGPRHDRPEDIVKCAACRQIVISGIDWDCSVQTLFLDENLGCGIAPANAITWFFDQVESGIILEDDCLPSKSFFTFCEELLQHYADNERVMHISGNNFQFGKKRGNDSYYFSNYINAWGWATWRRAWQHYDFNIESYSAISVDQILKSCLSTVAERKFWKAHFDSVQHGKRKDIWDYQWVYTVWKSGGISIIPNVNLVSNIGFGSDATHTFDQKSRVANNPALEIDYIRHPKSLNISYKADRLLFRTCHRPPLALKDRAYWMKERIKNIFKPVKHGL